MAQQAGGAGAGSGALGNQFGDTTFTKVFVGGLAWETQRDTMRRHFEQFGDILEAVVITDKNTGRSKGYGFVSTFFDTEPSHNSLTTEFSVGTSRCWKFFSVCGTMKTLAQDLESLSF